MVQVLNIARLPCVITCMEDTIRKIENGGFPRAFGGSENYAEIAINRGIPHADKKLGCTLAHLGALNRGWDLLRENQMPVLMLEEDATPTTQSRTIYVPEGTDALWCGNSLYGVTCDMAPVPGFSDLARAPTMMATHAFVVLTENYFRKRIALVVDSLIHGRGPDGVMVIGQDSHCVTRGLHRDTNTVACCHPLWVQSGYFERHTSVVLQPLTKSTRPI